MTAKPTCHFRRNGRPKVMYLTRAEAEDFRDRRAPGKRVYPCTFGAAGEHWHLGGRTDRWEPLDPTERSRARTRLEAIRTALGDKP